MVEYKEATNVVHGGVSADHATGAMLTPIYQSTAYKQDSVELYQAKGYTYSRCSNPTVSAFEGKIQVMEGASFPAVTFGSGMAATNCLLTTFLEIGDHVVVTRCTYGGTNRVLRTQFGKQFGVEITFVDFTDLEAIKKAIRPGKTKLVISETPCNPVLELADLAAISEIVAQANKEAPKDDSPVDPPKEGEGPSRACLRGKTFHVADTTMGPPVMQRGLDFGVDVLLLSLTKFYCGHNMNTGGALLTNRDELYQIMRFKQNVMGSILHASVAYTFMQTAKTLHIRIQRQSENAMKIATFLEKHPLVEWVKYPGLKSHPQHELALRQHRGIHGSMIAFEVRGGTAAGRLVMNACEHPWTLAENLGAVESIMTCPSVFTHANMTKEDREAAGITDGMIRLSVGIEDADDLIKALENAINAAKQ